MVRIFHFIFGRLFFRISGQHVERFLNLCAKNQVVLWDLKPDQDGYSFYIRKNAYEELKNLASKTNAQIKLDGTYGLPFFLREHRKRKAFFFSAAMALMVIFLLSQFVWEITVSGSEVYSENDILKYVRTNFYRPGTWKHKVDCDLLEEHLREDYDEIAWVSCSLTGTRLHVEIKETLDRETKQNPSSTCDIVANKKTYMLIKALELADPETKEELWGWIERKEFDHEEKIKAVTRIYDRLGIKELAFAAIDKYLKMSRDILDKIDVPRERKIDFYETLDAIGNRKK